MDKLTMAHEYALEMAKQGIPLKSCKELGWKYADAMQAEADNRKPSGLPKALQPEVNWRLAPQHTKKWEMIADRAKWVIQDSNGVGYCNAPSFGFTGTHIVERPHGF